TTRGFRRRSRRRETSCATRSRSALRRAKSALKARAPYTFRRGMTSAQLPENIGRYQIVRLLGRGGMGGVFLAGDPALGRQVAIKILPSPLQKDSKMRARFMNEARAIASFNHPNVVTIHDVGTTDARDVGFPDSVLYLVIEYVQGLALDEVMDKRSLT